MDNKKLKSSARIWQRYTGDPYTKARREVIDRMDNSKQFNQQGRVWHHDKTGQVREVARNAVDYGDGNVMVEYLDNHEIAIISKAEVHTSPNAKDIADLWASGRSPKLPTDATRRFPTHWS